MRKIYTTLALLFLLGGCQSLPSTDRHDTAEKTVDKKTLPEETIATYGGTEPAGKPESSTVVALLDAADKQAAAGNTGSARRTLERALRIEPRNARLWNELAHLYYREKNYAQAANTAAKSNSLAGSNHSLKYDNWKLIAETRRKKGDTAGARAADRTAEKYD